MWAQGSRDRSDAPIRSAHVSFRNRLALFFVLIVIVPMLAVAFLLFRLIDESATGQADAAIAQRHTFASSLFRHQRQIAGTAVEDVGRDRVFTGSLQEGDIDRARRRAEQLLESRALERIVFVKDGEAIVRAGDRRAIAPAVRPVVSPGGRPLGNLGVSVIDAPAFVRRVEELTGLQAAVLNGSKVLASSENIPAAELPTERGATQQVGDKEYRVQNFRDREAFAGQQIRVFTFGDASELRGSTRGDRLFAGAILLGFFLLAIACAVLVSRTLQQQIAGFLTAARRLAGGDFSAKVPTVGHDEFAELGDEFNKMSGELERRLAELGRERERVQGSMRRLGAAVGANLDRDELLDLVVQTAVDGVGADAGRAHVRANGTGTPEERSRVGRIDGLQSVLGSAEADAMRSGATREATTGAATVIAAPLHSAGGGDVIGVISVGRAGGSFSAGDRELFEFLAGQAARSMENVESFETATRESVTDDLTGLSNRRALNDALSDEVERAKRIGNDLALVLLDLDDFKAVNDTYGHRQGDAVLREVSRVLRESSREIDHPARYGGEELAVILPGTDLEGAFNRAERIREQIEQLHVPRLDGRGTLRVTTSCGVASAPPTAVDAHELLDAADKALYKAKADGKNRTERADDDGGGPAG